MFLSSEFIDQFCLTEYPIMYSTMHIQQLYVKKYEEFWS